MKGATQSCHRARAPHPAPHRSRRSGTDKRINIPTADSYELLDEDAARSGILRYERDPSLDPQLVWTGKDAQDAGDLVVDAPPIYIQEKILPQVIIESLRRVVEQPELRLFDDFDGLEGFEAVEYYRHPANWSNRMILGDSLQVMASLAEKENLRGKVQTIYLDPPYGIKFGSNWQPTTGKRDVKDGKLEDATREVEQIKAFRDTWELGIHSYLAYLRDRLAVARDLLTDSGSIFVQIGDENVHLVRCLLDEVFGGENFVSLITFKKTTSSTGELLSGVADYVLWYAMDAKCCKYRMLYQTREYGGTGSGQYTWFEHADGRRETASKEALRGELPGRLFRRDQLTSQGMGRQKGEGAASWFTVRIGNDAFTPGPRARWKTNESGMARLQAADRLVPVGKTLTYIRYFDDFPGFPYINLWEDTVTSGFGDPNVYVVQTNTKVVERCLLMTTDPGDLVLDPTCGSGTTAYVAERWGRRWITIDTSRVALALARQRVLGARFPYYLLTDSPEGRAKEAELTGRPQPTGDTRNDVRKGFVCQRVPHITLKSIANNPDIREGMSRKEVDAAIARHAETELLYDKPYEDRKKVRVAGPFTVESLSPHRTIAPDLATGSERAADREDASAFERSILDNLLKAGVQNGHKAERMRFATVASFPGERIQAEGTPADPEAGGPRRIAISLGPQYGTVDADWIRKAAREATRGLGFDLLLVCAFAFDARAASTAKEFKLGTLSVQLVRMNSDLAMGDVLLKKTGSGNLFTVFGEPDITVERTADGVVVEILGVDVYNPTTGEIRSSGPDRIALWMIDTDYDGESFFVRHCYFTGGNDPYKRLKQALRAEIDEAAWASLYSTRSRPFVPPTTGKIAVKVINHYGDEVMQVYDVRE